MKEESYINYSTESPSLANYLTFIINQYLVKFGKKPSVIRMPIWRQHELEECFEGEWTVTTKTIMPSFNGIIIIFIVGFNYIELQ